MLFGVTKTFDGERWSAPNGRPVDAKVCQYARFLEKGEILLGGRIKDLYNEQAHGGKKSEVSPSPLLGLLRAIKGPFYIVKGRIR